MVLSAYQPIIDQPKQAESAPKQLEQEAKVRLEQCVLRHGEELHHAPHPETAGKNRQIY